MSILALGRKEKKRKFPIKRAREKKKRKFPIKRAEEKQKEKIPNQRLRESKKRKKIPDQGLSPSKRKKKGNHDLKWSSPFDCQRKSYASVACSPHTKQKQKRKRPKHSKPNFPPKNPFPRRSPIDP